MATDTVAPKLTTMADLKGKVDPDWCPGCGDFGVLTAVQKGGSSGRFRIMTSPSSAASAAPRTCPVTSTPMECTRCMAARWRWPPASSWRTSMKVLVTGGDGDGFGIGGGHFIHTMRRNVDLTYIVMDNQIYGLTTGQASPTSRKGMKTKSTPLGNVEGPINPIALALSAGATYIARGFTGEPNHLAELIAGNSAQGLRADRRLQPCVTYNHDNTFQWFRPRVKKLEDNPEYDSTNWMAAMEKSLLWGDEIPIGKFFERTDVPTLDESEPVLAKEPLVKQTWRIPPDVARGFIEELM